MKRIHFIIILVFLFIVTPAIQGCSSGPTSTAQGDAVSPTAGASDSTTPAPISPTATENPSATITPLATPTPDIKFPVQMNTPFPQSFTYNDISGHWDGLSLIGKFGKGAFHSASFSPDGKWLVIASGTGLYRYEMPGLISETFLDQGNYADVSFSVDGQWLIEHRQQTNDIDVINFRDTQTWKIINSVDIKDRYYSARYIPETNQLEAWTIEGKIDYLEIPSGKVQSGFNIPSEDWWLSKISADQKIAIFPRSDGGIEIWDYVTHSKNCEFKNKKSLLKLEFIRNNNLLLDFGTDLLQYDQGCKLVRSIQTANTSKFWERDWDVSADGGRLAVTSQDGIQVYNLSDEPLVNIFQYQVEGGDYIQFAPTGEWLIQHQPLKGIQIFEIDSGKVAWENNSPGQIRFITTSKDSRDVMIQTWGDDLLVVDMLDHTETALNEFLAVNPGMTFKDDQSLMIPAANGINMLDLNSSQVSILYPGNVKTTSAALSPDKRFLAWIHYDTEQSEWQLQLEDLENNTTVWHTVLPLAGESAASNILKFSPDGKYIGFSAAYYSYPYAVHIFEAASGERLAKLTAQSEFPEFDFSPTRAEVVVSGQKSMKSSTVWSTQYWTPMLQIDYTPAYSSQLTYAPGGDSVSVMIGREIQLFSTISGFKLGNYGPISRAFSFFPWVQYSPDGKVLIIPGSDSIEFWDIKNNRQIEYIEFPDFLTGVAISPGGQFLALSFENMGVEIYGVPTR